MDEILATFQDDEFHGLPNADLKLFASITQQSEERIPTSDSLDDARIGDSIEQNKNINRRQEN